VRGKAWIGVVANLASCDRLTVAGHEGAFDSPLDIATAKYSAGAALATASAFGSLIRGRRKELKIRQAQLALATQPPTADDICRALEQSAAENAPSGRVLCPRDLAGEPFRCARCQPQGGGRNRSIHAADRQLARPRGPLRSDRGSAALGGLLTGIDGPVWQSRTGGCGI
jgi:hypothetical protein